MNEEQRRLLRILGRMPLAGASDLALILATREHRVRRMLQALPRENWAVPVRRGMTEPPRERWFLTRRAVEALYSNDHQHPTPREQARAVAVVSRQ